MKTKGNKHKVKVYLIILIILLLESIIEWYISWMTLSEMYSSYLEYKIWLTGTWITIFIIWHFFFHHEVTVVWDKEED